MPPDKLKAVLQALESQDVERFLNFSFAVINLNKVSYSNLEVSQLFELAKSDLRALRVLFSAAAKRGATVETKNYFIQALKIQKNILKPNLFVDLLLEVSAYDKSVINRALWNELTAGMVDPRI